MNKCFWCGKQSVNTYWFSTATGELYAPCQTHEAFTQHLVKISYEEYITRKTEELLDD